MELKICVSKKPFFSNILFLIFAQTLMTSKLFFSN